MHSVIGIDVKNWTYKIDPNKIKMVKKSYKNVFIYCTEKNCEKANSGKLLYHIINKINGLAEESNGNKHLALVPADESKRTLKYYE